MKKIHFLLLALFVVLAWQGCAKEETYTEAETYNQYTKTYLFSSADSTIDERIEEDITAEDVIDRNIIGAGSEVCLVCDFARTGQIGNNKLYYDYYLYQYESGSMMPIVFEEYLQEESVYPYAAISQNGNIFLANEKSAYCYDLSGKLHCKADTESFGAICELECDDKYVYIVSDANAKLYILDYDLNVLSCEEQESAYYLLPNYFNRCMIANDKNEFFQYEDEKGFHEISDFEIELDSMIETDGLFNISAGDKDYDLYYSATKESNEENDSVDGFIGIKDGMPYKLFSFQQMGFMPENVCDVISLANGAFIVCYNNPSIMLKEYYHITPCEEVMDYSLENDKQILYIGGLMIPAEFRNVVLAFNNSSSEYYIELKEYTSAYGDSKDALNSLYMDAVVNQSLDGLLLYGLERTDLENNDVLCNLKEYYAESSVVSADDFLPVIRENMQNEEGEILSTYPDFSLVGLVVKEETEIEKFVSGTVLSEEKVMFADSGMNVFMQMVKYSGTRFVDKEGGQVCLDDTFRQLMELTKESCVGDGIDITAIQDGEAVTVYTEFVMPYSYTYYDSVFDDDITLTNYGCEAPIIVPSFSEFGITSYSANKEGMYAFLDYMYTDEIYHRYFGNQYFPVLQSFYDDWVIRVTATENYTDRFGEEILAGDFLYGVNDVTLELGNMSEEETDKLTELLSSAVYVEPVDLDYLGIISEEVQYYYEGVKSAEEVCETLEARLSIAVNE